LAALIPMTLFGIVSIYTARETARALVMEENLEVAKRAAHQIEQYLDNSEHILKSLAQNLGKTDLLPWQKERFVRNHVIEFEEFHSIDLTDGAGKILATSRLDNTSEDAPHEEAHRTAASGATYRSKVFISDNFSPAMIVGIPIKFLGETVGVLVGELNLIEMWRLVDSIRIGEEGVALVVSEDLTLIAHGLGSEKGRVFRQEKISDLPFSEGVHNGQAAGEVYFDTRGIETIGVAAQIPSVGWQLMIEQPTREAYAASALLTQQLTVSAGLFLVLMIAVGFLGGKRHIVAPIRELIRGARSVGSGNLSDKVKIRSRDEFRELGEAFNLMTEDLVKLKENIRRNERAAFLGRIAGGLVHDLRHPIKNLENSSRLVTRSYNDEKTQAYFQKMIDREFPNLNRMLNDLLHLSHTKQIKPALFPLSDLTNDILDPLKIDTRCWVQEDGKEKDIPMKENKVLISTRIMPKNLQVWADRFALERVLRNLVTNGIEAMPQGGALGITGKKMQGENEGDEATEISISDTGCGIPPDRLKHLFVDYASTKNKGIGLGLAICKKIIEDHKGQIKVESRPGRGTVFTILLPFQR
ncbi:MAG: ATP-binding protein, partial [Nitrospiria bacterium]